jgi:hypothetical protein
MYWKISLSPWGGGIFGLSQLGKISYKGEEKKRGKRKGRRKERKIK